MKIGCTNKDCPGYLRPIDERAPFSEIPRCSVDRKTKHRLAERGKGKVWPCPKHPVSAKSSKRIGRTLLRFVCDDFTGCDLRRVWEHRD